MSKVDLLCYNLETRQVDTKQTVMLNLSDPNSIVDVELPDQAKPASLSEICEVLPLAVQGNVVLLWLQTTGSDQIQADSDLHAQMASALAEAGVSGWEVSTVTALSDNDRFLFNSRVLLLRRSTTQ